jgi:hypothetical protein
MIVQKHTVCYTSERGHKNFFYPSLTKMVIKEECKADRLPWLSISNKVALRIPTGYLVPLDFTQNTAENISPPSNNLYTIVWVEKCLLN